MKELFKKYEHISKMFNPTKEETEVLTFNFDKKLLDNPKNQEGLKELLINEFGKFLMIAGTGTGKTYSILETIKQFSNMRNVLNDDVVYLFTIPNRAQNLQIIEEYGVFGLYGGRTINENFKGNLIVPVYDKVDEAVEYCKKNNKKYKIIVDEAHQLNLARYRAKALRKLKEAIEGAELTVYLTATPNSLLFLDFSKIYNFESKESNNMAKMFKLLECNKNFKASIKAYSIKANKKGFKVLYRYNDIDATKDLVNDLTKLGYKCLLINSNEKESEYNGEAIVYKNELTNEIINFSNLPDADFYFCTSILDAGINIKTLGGKNDLSNLELVFVVPSSRFTIDEILQFSARPRTSYKCFSILKSYNEEVKTPLTLEQNINYYKEKILNEIEYIKANIELLKKKYKNNKEEVFRELSYQLNYKDIDNISNDLNGSIEIDENLNVTINSENLYYFCYIKTNEQLYHNNHELMNSICDKYTLEKIYNKDVEIDTSYKEEIANILIESLTDKTKLKELKGTEELKDYNTLIELGFKKEEAVNTIVNENKSFKKVKNSKIVKMMQKLKNEDIEELNKVIRKEQTKLELRAGLQLIAESEAFDCISKLHKEGLGIKEVLNNVDNYDDLKDLTDNYKYIKTNIKYLNNEKLLLKSERTQAFIIKYFEKWDLKRQKLTKHKIEELKELINKEYDEKYESSKILNIVSKIFVIDDDNSLKGLRITYADKGRKRLKNNKIKSIDIVVK